MLLLTLRGTPTVYYGDELGMHDVPIPPALVQDPAEKQQPGIGVGRDPERTPMQWDGAAGAGFTTGTPWLPIASDANAVNVAAERADSASMLTLYHDLLALRRAEPGLARGAFRMLARQGDVLAYVREDDTRAAGGDRFLVVVNFAGTAGTYVVEPADVQRLTDGGRRRAVVAAGTHDRRVEIDNTRIALRPNEAMIVRFRAAPPR